MEQQINNDVLCILNLNNSGKEIVVSFEPIKLYLSDELQILSKFCYDKSSTISQITNFIGVTPNFKLLNGQHKYCKKLDGSYQGFIVDIELELKKIKERNTLTIFNQTQNPDTSTLDEDVTSLKAQIINDFDLWTKSFNIKQAYNQCTQNIKILAFSHRINGWSNPIYKLNPEFSIELKTNFGYGSASYFYIKIKFKNIDITPVSEWVNYEIAKFSEIIRYSKSFTTRIFRGIYNNKRVYKTVILNSDWLRAMEYAKDACNFSNTNEIEFIEKYILNECEKMIDGLQHFNAETTFQFEGETDNYYDVDKTGHQLIEFRGEKISGALDFISKIMEYNAIINVEKFILRIEQLNLEIKPILENEKIVIKRKLNPLQNELDAIIPIYEKQQLKQKDYDNGRKQLKAKLFKERIFDDDNIFNSLRLEEEFTTLFPEYKEFETLYNRTKKDYDVLWEKIEILEKLQNDIILHLNKINFYFK